MICYTDGGYRNDGNKESNGSGYGSCLLETENGEQIQFETFDLPYIHSNNEAEYMSLIHLLNILRTTFPFASDIIIYSDSQLLVNQVNNRWKINYKKLQDLKNIVDSFKIKFTLEWKPREEIYLRLGH